LIRRVEPIAPKRVIKENLAIHFMFALGAWLTGLAFCALFPSYMGVAQNLLNKSCGQSAIAGFGGLVILPLAAFFLFLSLIGIPLSLLILLFYCILLYLSKIAVALWIGSALLRRREFNPKKVASPLALGLLVLYTLFSIIVAEMVINILVIILGLGALLIALFKKPVLVIQTPDPFNELTKKGNS